VTHPRHDLDELLGHPVRFSMMALLVAAEKAEFAFVRDNVEVSDSVMSKQMSLLEDVGYVRIKKGFVGKRPRTWLSLTRKGREVFERHLKAVREIAAGNSLAPAS
jgi:DNA-binding MarR family transcriptional regulator